MFQPFVSTLTLWAATCALSGAMAAGISQGETPLTTLCLDTGNARITRLCAKVSLRYKIDALMDVPLSTYGLTWAPTSWTFSQLDGSSKTVPHDRLPTPVGKALSAVTLQIKGTALVDFSANTPLQFLQYQTNAAAMNNKVAWTGASRAPMDKWLFTPGQCPDARLQSLDPAKAMALYKLGVKSLSIDPRSSASVCKTGTVVSQLDGAARMLDLVCHQETTRPGTRPHATGLCLPPTQAGIPTPSTDTNLNQAKWAAMLDEGVPPHITRPTAALLDDPVQSTVASTPARTTVSSATHLPD
jgi:hypothetical protein